MSLRSDFKISAGFPAQPSEEPRTGSAIHTVISAELTALPGEEVRTGGAVRAVAYVPEEPLFTLADWKIPARDGDTGIELLKRKPHPRRVAMLVTHGMGQQVPFETLSALGQALVTKHMQVHHEDTADDANVTIRRVTLTREPEAPELSRAEVRLKDLNGEPVDVHIYESYWAPLTEGQITFMQTVGFLYSAGWNGLKTCFGSGYKKKENATPHTSKTNTAPPKPNSGGTFERWIFGNFHALPIKRGTLLLLFATLVLISAVLLPALAIFLVKSLFAAGYLHIPSWSILKSVLVLGAAVLVLVLALVVRYFAVEYVGDVAIYVSSYKVSRFQKIRDEILTTACTISQQIYSAGVADNHEKRYDSVVIVGHSLGSVISYDLLNAAINWDQVECEFKYEVVGRTTRLITFGSPLDKTAFLFRSQVNSARNLREALAARQQPLILDYAAFRPQSFRWINIYSPRDVVSGSLEYYDLPEVRENPDDPRIPVFNLRDKQAWKPLIAHVQYWDNEALHDVLYEAAFAGARTSAGG
jgi:hypothetical protein